MPIPGTQEIRKPLLEAFKGEAPHSFAINDFLELTAGYFGLESGELSSGDKNILKSRITEAKNDLKKNNLISNPSKNTYMITNAGIEVLEDNPDIISDEYLNARNNRTLSEADALGLDLPVQESEEQFQTNDSEITPDDSEPLSEESDMPAEDYAAVRESIDASTARGKRDLAMLLLMGNLGLRQSDVALLDLDDVDWANGVLRVRDSKSISDRSIPLDEETGYALQDYVMQGRPRATSRSLFLPCGNEAPGERMGFGQVGGAIELAAQKAGVMLHGTHSLRRAVASAMVNGGIPIKFVADVLGHESVKTTMGYLRVDVEQLRKAASPWPGEVTS